LESVESVAAATPRGGHVPPGLQQQETTLPRAHGDAVALLHGPPGLGSARTHRRRALRQQAWRLMVRRLVKATQEEEWLHDAEAVKATKAAAPVTAAVAAVEETWLVAAPATNTGAVSKVPGFRTGLAQDTQVLDYKTVVGVQATVHDEWMAMEAMSQAAIFHAIEEINRFEDAAAAAATQANTQHAQMQTDRALTDRMDFYYDMANRPLEDQRGTYITQEQIWDECLDQLELAAEEWASQFNIQGRMAATWRFHPVEDTLVFIEIEDNDVDAQ